MKDELTQMLEEIAEWRSTSDTVHPTPDSIWKIWHQTAKAELAKQRGAEPGTFLRRYTPSRKSIQPYMWQLDPSPDGDWVSWDDVAQFVGQGGEWHTKEWDFDRLYPVTWIVRNEKFGRQFSVATKEDAEWLATALNNTHPHQRDAAEVTDEMVDAACEAFDNVYEATIDIGDIYYHDNKRVAIHAALSAVALRDRENKP